LLVDIAIPFMKLLFSVALPQGDKCANPVHSNSSKSQQDKSFSSSQGQCDKSNNKKGQ